MLPTAGQREDRLAAKFAERPQDEVRRIPIPCTRVHKQNPPTASVGRAEWKETPTRKGERWGREDGSDCARRGSATLRVMDQRGRGLSSSRRSGGCPTATCV
jgi:hypothetical protein